jgi:hypothetical protein
VSGERWDKGQTEVPCCHLSHGAGLVMGGEMGSIELDVRMQF